MTEGMKARAVGLAMILAGGMATVAEAQAPVEAPAAERYRLVEAAGVALPALIEKEWNCSEYVTRGTLTLEPDSLWLLRTTIREECGGRAEVETEVESGRYTAQGGTIRFLDDDGREDRDREVERDIDLDDLWTGTIASDGTLTVRLEDEKTTLVFRK